MELPLLVTIALTTLFAGIAAGLWSRHRSAKAAVSGLGWVLLPIGLHLTGLMRLAVNGVMSIVDWAQRTVWTDTVSWGAGVLGTGLLLLLVGGLMKSRPRPAAEGTAQRRGVGATGVAPAVRPQVPGRGAAVTPSPRTTSAGPAATDPEDAEIEALLKKRGIM